MNPPTANDLPVCHGTDDEPHEPTTMELNADEAIGRNLTCPTCEVLLEL